MFQNLQLLINRYLSLTGCSRSNVVYKNISTFLFSCIIGLVSNLIIIANPFYYNHDSVTTVSNNADWLLSQGKWFVTPLSSFYGEYNIHFIASILGIICFALAATVFVTVFGVNKTSTKWLIGALFTSFPSVATCMLYHSANYFGGAFLLAVCGSCMMLQESKVINVFGIILMCLSIGAYQANIGVNT